MKVHFELDIKVCLYLLGLVLILVVPEFYLLLQNVLFDSGKTSFNHGYLLISLDILSVVQKNLKLIRNHPFKTSACFRGVGVKNL